MTGVSFTRGGYHRIGKRVTYGAGGYTMHRPEHWIFDGTGLDYGDVLGAGATIVGYECDGCDFTYRDGLPYPTGTDGTPIELRDPRHRARRPLHPHDRVAAARAARTRPRSSSSRRASSTPATRRRSSASPTATPCSAPTCRRAAAR